MDFYAIVEKVGQTIDGAGVIVVIVPIPSIVWGLASLEGFV